MKDLNQEILLDLTDEVILHSHFIELKNKDLKRDLIEKIRKEAKGSTILISFWKGTSLIKTDISKELLLKYIKGIK